MAIIGKQKKRIGQMLVEERLVTEEQIDAALEQQKNSGKKIGEKLVDAGLVTDEQIARVLSHQLGIPMISLKGSEIANDIVSLIPVNILRKYCAIPLEYDPDNLNILRVAMSDPMDMVALDDMGIITNLQIEPLVAPAGEILQAIDKHFGNSEALEAADKYAKEHENRAGNADNESEDEELSNSPIVLLVRSVIEQAARQRASDIHIEALENKVRIRFRVDGALYESQSAPISLLPAIVARIKVISGLDISEKRKPQDGRITQIVDRKEYDIRVSVLPTVYGEKIVMRLAQKKALTRDKKDLGFTDSEMKRFDHILSNPNGIVLVTGPTGSGKSTTLYTALSELNSDDVNIITVEDPVEANIDGVNQVQVNPKANLTFATALRSILRQDPDIIMIGEIRDSETAGIAVQASITGHLVVSTLHTNSSANTITRLMDMGIESYLIADSVVGVIAQRLVRKLCTNCRIQVEATPEEKKLMGKEHIEHLKIYKPCGCPMCNNTGYFGRTGVYEIMEVTPELKRIIARNASADEIKDQALKDGMLTLRMAAAEKVVEGITGISEMMRVSFES